MNQSESITKLSEALAKAQSEMSHAHRAADNPYFKSKYADLPAVIDAARPHLSTNGLSVVQVTDHDEVGMWVYTQLSHSSGEWIRGKYKVKPVKDDPQGIGSAITYARRYAYQAMVGIASSLDDDDGNAASGLGKKQTAPLSNEQAVEIDLLIAEVGANKDAFLKWLGVDDVRNIPANKYKEAKEKLEAKRAK
jgi:hypothetical protein